MSLKYGKKQVATMAAVLNGEYASVEEAAEAALAEAERIFEERAQFVVVGQLAGSRDRLTIPASDPEAIKLSLGWYSTAGDAQKAADSLWQSTASGDTFRTWVLNVFHGTPADLHQKRKQQYVDLEQKQAEKKQETLRKSIERIALENEERAKRVREMEAAAGGQPWPCWQTRIKSGACEHTPRCK